MATPCSIIAREVPRAEEPGGLQSMGSQGVGHDRSDLALEQEMRAWSPQSQALPSSHGRASLLGPARAASFACTVHTGL